jgi:hypothetical protein
MAEKTFGEEFSEIVAKEVTGKAIAWGPAVACALLLGPAGLLLGFATSVLIADNLPSGGDPPKD